MYATASYSCFLVLSVAVAVRAHKTLLISLRLHTWKKRPTNDNTINSKNIIKIIIVRALLDFIEGTPIH